MGRRGERRGNAHDRLCSEPRRKDGGHHDRQGETAPGDRKIPGVVDASRRKKADADRNQQIDNDERQNHSGVDGG